MPVMFRLLLLLLLMVPAGLARGNELDVPQAPPASDQPPDRVPFVGETLDYEISFLWFDRLATGRLSFRPGDRAGVFRAELEAKTLGVASWLTGDRVQRYRTEMERTGAGQLRTLFHESQVTKGTGKNRREKGKRYLFDYSRHAVRVQRLGAEAEAETVLPMEPGDQLNDFLTAFYNFRAGSFGPLREGGRYAIPTFTRKGRAEIVVQLLTRQERPAGDFFPAGGWLARIELDPEVLDTGGGAVYLWFDDAERPARGIVENVLGLGDVRGLLRTPAPAVAK